MGANRHTLQLTSKTHSTHRRRKWVHIDPARIRSSSRFYLRAGIGSGLGLRSVRDVVGAPLCCWHIAFVPSRKDYFPLGKRLGISISGFSKYQLDTSNIGRRFPSSNIRRRVYKRHAVDCWRMQADMFTIRYDKTYIGIPPSSHRRCRDGILQKGTTQTEDQKVHCRR